MFDACRPASVHACSNAFVRDYKSSKGKRIDLDMNQSQNIQEALQRLEAEEGELVRRVEERKAELKLDLKVLRQLRKNMAGLSGCEASQSRPTLSDEAAREFIRRAIRKSGPQMRGDLQRDLVAFANSQGCTGTGAHLVLARVIKSPEFDVHGDRVALSDIN